MGKFYTVKELALMTRRTPQTIYRWIKKRRIENVKVVSDGYLIPEASVDGLFKNLHPTKKD